MRLINKILTRVIILGSICTVLFAQEPYEGLTFYSSGKSAYLYDMDKNLVHTWKSDYNSAATAHLLRDSSVLYSGRDVNGWSGGVLHGGRFQIIKWNGDLAWDFEYSSSQYCPHHNMEIMYYTDDPKEVPNVIASVYQKGTGMGSARPDKLVEIKPTGLKTGEIVWEWNSWDHKTTDPDNHPELLEDPGSNGREWTHVNNISWNRDLDQLIVDIKSFHEIIILDHSTTTQEAAGSTGGKYGKGGTILYRWGQARNYGISGNDYLSGFHGGAWVHTICPRTFEPLPGGGKNVLFFHNDEHELFEITLPGLGDGVYPRESGAAFGPKEPIWSVDQRLSRHEGSIQKLPNGNYLIGDPDGGIYEIAPSGEKVWSITGMRCNQARRYSYSYLDPNVGIKSKSFQSKDALSFTIDTKSQRGLAKITFSKPVRHAQVSAFTLSGKKIFSNVLERHSLEWDISSLACGTYIVQANIGTRTTSNFFNVVK